MYVYIDIEMQTLSTSDTLMFVSRLARISDVTDFSLLFAFSFSNLFHSLNLISHLKGLCNKLLEHQGRIYVLIGRKKTCKQFFFLLNSYMAKYRTMFFLCCIVCRRFFHDFKISSMKRTTLQSLVSLAIAFIDMMRWFQSLRFILIIWQRQRCAEDFQIGVALRKF